MKRLYLILLLAAMALSGMAQNVGEAIYVFRNDGHHDGFLRSEVISIDYSYEDEDGNVYDEVVTQVITTPDSVYKIPLAIIDSISFVQPETVYQDDVVPLTGDLYQYVIGADGQKLKFKANTPSSLLPKVGDKIALLEMTDVLPTGFMGRVNSISIQTDAIVLDCEGIGLLETAKQYYSVGFIDILSEGGQTSPILRSLRGGDIGHKYILPPLGQYLNVGSDFYKTSDNLLLSAGVEAYFLINPVIEAKGIAMVDDEIGAYVNMVAFTDLNYEWSCKFSGGFSSEAKQTFLGEGVDIPIIPGINFYFDVGIYAKLEGEICWQANGDGSYRLVLQAIGDLLHPENNALTPRLKKNYSNQVNTMLAGSLTTKLGLYGEVGLSIGSAKLMKGGIEAALGLKAEASITAFKLDWENAATSTHLYEQLTTPGNGEVSVGFFGEVGLVGSFASGLAHGGLSVDFDLGPNIFTGGFVPVFENVKTSWILPFSKAQSSASIERNVLTPVQLGFTAVDKDGKRVETVYDEDEYLASFLKNYYVLTFQDLDYLENYKVYPIITLFGREVLASPCVDLNSEQSVTTVDATDVSESSACINGQLALFKPNMDGSVFFLYGTDDNPKTSGTFVSAGEASSLSNTNFRVILSNLQPGTTYYYIAGYNDGKKTYYGDVLSFETIDPNRVLTIAASDITKTEATLKGYYESTDFSPEYGFIYGTSSDLTYTSGNRIIVSASSNGYFSFSLSYLTEKTTYYYRAYLKTSAKLYYGDLRYFKTRAEPINPCPDGNHPHMVDLGLPSGKKWACCNVAATGPFEGGGRYAWGETSEKEEYTLDNYNSPYHYGQVCLKLPIDKDAATVIMGNNWCMPSFYDICELIGHCSYIGINELGQEEIEFPPSYVKMTGQNGNSIVLPMGVYWSSEEHKNPYDPEREDWYWVEDNYFNYDYLRYAYAMQVYSEYSYLYYWARVSTEYNTREFKWNGNFVRAVVKK